MKIFKTLAFIFMASLIAFCFYLMFWEADQHKIASDKCAAIGYKTLGGRDYTLCVDPKTNIVYYIK